MLREKTLFVVGAGASAEFRLPVGTALQETIASLVNIRFDEFGSRRVSGDDRIYHLLQQRDRSLIGEYIEAGRHIHEAVRLSYSIDNFIDSHADKPRVGELGRLGIVRAISMAEHASSLRIDPSNIYNDVDFDGLQGTWLPTLFTAMQEGVRADHVSDFFQNASFVIFNYDRCVEHFFVRALMRFYQLSEENAGSIVDGAGILHPYGVIGLLPWQRAGAGTVVEFGNPDRSLEVMAKGIRTYTQEIRDETTIARIKHAVTDVHTICFLGFSYQRQNINLLAPRGGGHAKRILGSTYGMSDFAMGDIRSMLKKTIAPAMAGEPLIDGIKCAEFIQKYDRAFR